MKYDHHCKLYSKFVRTTPKGFKCQLCPLEFEKKVALLDHLKFGHPNLTKFFKTQRVSQTKVDSVAEIISEDGKKLCDVCQEIFPVSSDSNFERHVQSCRLYFRFMNATPGGFQCQLCPCKTKKKNLMYAHFRSKHQNVKDFDDSEKNDEQSINLPNKVNDQETFRTNIESNIQPEQISNKRLRNVHEEPLTESCPPVKQRRVESSSSHEILEMKVKESIENIKTGKLNPWIPKGFFDKICTDFSNTTTCFFCEEIVSKHEIVQHKKNCSEASKIVQGSLCQKCNIEFQCKFQVYQHVKKEHLKQSVNESVKKEESFTFIDCDIAEEMIDDSGMKQTENEIVVKKEATEVGTKTEAFNLAQTNPTMLPNEIQDVKSDIVVDPTDVPNQIPVLEKHSVEKKSEISNNEDILLRNGTQTSESVDINDIETLDENLTEINETSLQSNKPNQCNFCKKVCSSSGNLKQHINSCKVYYKFIEKSDGGFKCKVCGLKTSKRLELNSHIKSKHLNGGESKSGGGTRILKNGTLTSELIDIIDVETFGENDTETNETIPKAKKPNQWQVCQRVTSSSGN